MGLALDEPAEDDVKQDINGIHVAIEEQILSHVDGVTLDVETTDDDQQGLVMHGGPNSDSDCC
ncbi:hypothetical protein D7Z54_11715 [Salibacterium salarium]|uniref:HesB-like selenoprotein n=1 Tax=Salibacterium salarium TaxID=284579 RepID=A0A428N481_9BACI|nr:hypothetical protein [Salibacterium salarium]RSL33284.1 hypothetical protein D7Z54_11715 [Salibacterium salarium]